MLPQWLSGGIAPTMHSIVYNIPASLVEAYRGRKLIVRARGSSGLVESLAESDFEDLLYVRLLSFDADIDSPANWGLGAPVEVADPKPISRSSTCARITPPLPTVTTSYAIWHRHKQKENSKGDSNE
jgi:hypothetical protein